MVDHFLDAHNERRCRSFWTWMPPMIRFMDIRKDGSFMAITTATVICRYISSVESFC